MTNFLQIFTLIVKILPLIIETMKTVEETIPGDSKGEQKLAIVRGILEAAYNAAGDMVVKFPDIWTAVEKTIGGLVSVFNKLGIFKKSA
jgi:hypothetical protein